MAWHFPHEGQTWCAMLMWYARGMLMTLACLQNVDLVIEGTGVFVNSEGAGKHLHSRRQEGKPCF